MSFTADPGDFNLELQHKATSFFSDPHGWLDPRLFESGELKEWIAEDIELLIFDFLSSLGLTHIEQWVHIWLAGSGVSYQWVDDGNDSDLDCLIGIEWNKFRQFNDEFTWMSNQAIASYLNDKFYSGLNKDHWHGFELTFYVNASATDIRSINPYAAWDVRCGCWTVTPDSGVIEEFPREWHQVSEKDIERTREVASRYESAKRHLQNATNQAHRVNAERWLMHALEEGSALYDEIHHARNEAFSESGGGYKSFANFRWQKAKSHGVKNVLEDMKKYLTGLQGKKFTGTFGAEIPSSETLITRAVLAKRHEL